MAIGRYLTHAAVLLVAVVLSGYASWDRNLPSALSLRLGAVNAEGLVMGEGGEVSGVQLGRLSTIVKPVSVPTTEAVSHDAIEYVVKDGDTLKGIAARFKVSVEGIRWSNWTALKNTARDVTKGQTILIPPPGTDGLVVRAKAGDSPATLADAYRATPQAILDFNYLRIGDSDPIPEGKLIVIPGGRGADFEQPVSPLRPSLTGSRTGAGYTVGGYGGSVTAASGNRFPYGYCTWYVYNRRPVPWLGNAWEWFGNAQAAGWRTGQTPRAGGIMVTWESRWGHVAYVESVAADGSWTVSEMNFVGWGIISSRTIRPGGVPLIGFIYGPP